MSGSFKKIDYSIRPAKYAERRMLRDIFRRVSPFSPPETYTYVGFGSVWFSDFILFHRSLGVRDMISIESSTAVQQRVADNAPFRIALKFGHSSRELRRLDWTGRKFIWLDYDDRLDKSKLSDLRFIAGRAVSGTLLAVTVRADAAREFDQDKDSNDDAVDALGVLDRFKENFDLAQFPPDLAEEDLIGAPFSHLCRTMMTTEIGAGLDVRNGATADPMRFRTVCSFNYGDSVDMTTLVGLFHTEGDKGLADLCGFNQLDFLGDPNVPIEIEVPLLTVKEIRQLDSQLPLGLGVDLNFGSMPEGEGRKFQKFYRYFPSYVVLEN